jgi:hypothetical protein
VDVNQDPDGALSRLYRSGAGEEPPSWLDDRILAAARSDALSESAPGQPQRRGRWQVPLALAAVIVLAVSVTRVVDQELDRVPVVAYPDRQASHADTSKPAEAPASDTEADEVAAREQSSLSERAAKTRLAAEARLRRDRSEFLSLPPATGEVPAAKEGAEPDRQRQRPPADLDRAAVERQAQNAQADPTSPQLPDAAVPSAPAPAAAAAVPERSVQAAEKDARSPAEAGIRLRAEAETRKHAEAEARAHADRDAEADARRSAQSTPRAAPRPLGGVARFERSQADESSHGNAGAAASAPAGVEAHPPMDKQRSPGQKADSERPEARSAAEWLRDIERLRREGRDEQARIQLEAFRVRFPDYPLPPTLK